MAVTLATAMSYIPLSRSWRVEWSIDGPWKALPDSAYPNPRYAIPTPPFNVVDDLEVYNLITAEYLVSTSRYTFRDMATFVAWGSYWPI